MNGRRILLGAMLLFALGSAIALFFTSRELNATQNAPFVAFDFNAIPSIGKLECTIARTDANGLVLGTMQVLDKNVRIDLRERDMHIIIRDGLAYAWYGEESKGALLNSATITAALNGPREPEKDVSCKRVMFLDKKPFDLPSNVNFES